MRRTHHTGPGTNTGMREGHTVIEVGWGSNPTSYTWLYRYHYRETQIPRRAMMQYTWAHEWWNLSMPRYR